LWTGQRVGGFFCLRFWFLSPVDLYLMVYVSRLGRWRCSHGCQTSCGRGQGHRHGGVPDWAARRGCPAKVAHDAARGPPCGRATPACRPAAPNPDLTPETGPPKTARRQLPGRPHRVPVPVPPRDPHAAAKLAGRGAPRAHAAGGAPKRLRCQFPGPAARAGELKAGRLAAANFLDQLPAPGS
jgi:hypothetical protein